MTASEIKYIKSLSQKKFRDAEEVFTVEGEKLVEEALHSGFEVLNIYRREEIGEKAMERISNLNSPSPILAIVRQGGLPALSKPGPGLYLALDGIHDPGNLGTILRIADWFGIDGVYASPDTVEVYNPKVVQATMGAIFRVRYKAVSIPELCRSVVSAGGRVYGTFLDGNNIYDQELSCGQSAPALIVIGSESDGISKETAACVSDRLYIPPYPAGNSGSESLNAAVACAVTVAEFRRRG